MHQGWTEEKCRDDSLVYRHDATGCTLQRLRKGPGEGVTQHRVRWLLFTRFHELLRVFEPDHRDEPAPFQRAEQVLQAIPPTEMREGASAGVNLFGTYAVIEGPD